MSVDVVRRFPAFLPATMAIVAVVFWFGSFEPAAAEGPAGSRPTAATAEVGKSSGRIGFAGRNIFGRANGVFHDWRILDYSIDLANPAASFALVEVSLASVDTQTKARDEHLRSEDFFDVAKYPVATVRGHSPRSLAPSASGKARYAIALDVDLHGQKKTLQGEVEVVETNPTVVEGAFTILRTDFGVGSPPSGWNPASIADEVPVQFRIAFE
jgi:polyisoprenoid-binding protein YceI